MGSATRLHLTQVQDRPADTISKLTKKLSMDRGAVISRHLFCITNIFVGLHIIFICKHFYTKREKKKNTCSLHNIKHLGLKDEVNLFIKSLLV